MYVIIFVQEEALLRLIWHQSRVTDDLIKGDVHPLIHLLPDSHGEQHVALLINNATH